jgi:hypothetical protein
LGWYRLRTEAPYDATADASNNDAADADAATIAAAAAAEYGDDNKVEARACGWACV